ncbi:TIGR04438 family Trp-rich protein [Roseateles koreensis]|uniref:TIGR04438 family Trp-rich protein n=1 Tax=Roseateles koreensis TaxID=2987526 RepID=A0ABT5KVK3_9BURK|nr:TIGR04438 family Trp-rich protein [Roseateles koreensis]MDC8786969.1 TIGR04438 family Trp-rich protein [Roseateles koreensis]
MWFVSIGVILLILKLLEWTPVATWSWWWVGLPFALAVVWWSWADASGWTQRQAMRQMDEKKAQRRARSMNALGQDEGKSRR